jgi:hypothetical protein
VQREPNAPESAAAPTRVPQWAYPAVTVASVLIGAAAIVRGTRAVVSASDSDLTTFFFKSADYILRGDPFHIYAVNVGGYPNYNPPLSIFLMAPLLKLAHLVGFAANYGEQITFVCLPFVLLIPLLGIMVVRALRRLYPEIPEVQLLLAYVLVALSPLTWQSIATWYHIEQPLMLCFLIGAVLALQRRREGLAGVLAGLAVLSRTTALMPLIALGVLLLLAREWRSLARFAGVGAAVVALAMAPFFLTYPSETAYSLLSWRGGAAIGGNTIWAIFGYTGSNSLLHLVDAVARRLDMYAVVLFIVVVVLLAVRRRRVSAFGADAWALLAVASLAVPMLSKTNWPYYYLEPFIFLLIWEFATMHDRVAGVWRWPVLTFSFLAVAATLSQFVGLRSVGYLDRVVVGVLSSGAMLAFVGAIWARLAAKKGVPATAGAGLAWPDRSFAAAFAAGAGPSAPPAPPAVGITGRVPAPTFPPNPSGYAAPAAPSAPYGAPPTPGNSGNAAPLWPPASSGSYGAEPPSQALWPSPAPSAPDAGQQEQWPDLWPDGQQPGSGWTPQR